MKTIFSVGLFPVNRGRMPKKGWQALAFILMVAITLGLTNCNSDKVGDNYYTFTGTMMGKYLKDDDPARIEDGLSKRFGEFYKMLDTTGVIGLLNAYGQYTCFAPNDSAMKAFYLSKGKNSVKDFPLDSMKKIVYDHIISGQAITSSSFGEGFLSGLTMSGRNLKIDYSSNAQGMVIVVNNSSNLKQYDIEVHNGVIHEIDKAISPSEMTLEEAIGANPRFTVFNEALVATGLNKEIQKVKDESFDPGDMAEKNGELQDDHKENSTAGNTIWRVPLERKYGFTALIESNETLAKNGITNLEEMKAYAKKVYDQVFPDDASITDVTDRRNSLNRFVAYHLINKKIGKIRFVEEWDNTGPTANKTHSVKKYDMFEYIETLCPNTLLEVRSVRFSNEYNVFNMIAESGKAVRLVAGNTDNDAINGVYHEIDGILEYSYEWERELSGKKLKLEAASFFPEFANNNIRVGCAFKGATPLFDSERWFIPEGFLDRVECSETTIFGYYNADGRFMDYQGDEVFLQGLYDFSIETPAIPAGTYEVRFGYQPTGGRGVAQLYWDKEPCGIPLDLRLLADNPKIGYETPNSSNIADPYGYENDKMMRNRGYMKGPADYTCIKTDFYSGASARMSKAVLRRILGIYTFKEAGTHVFSVKAARAGQFMLDYLEFVPVEMLASEGIE